MQAAGLEPVVARLVERKQGLCNLNTKKKNNNNSARGGLFLRRNTEEIHAPPTGK